MWRIKTERSLSKEIVKRLLKQPNGPEKLMSDAEAAFEAAWELYISGFAPAGAFLARCVKRVQFKARVKDKLIFERESFLKTLSSVDPKLRKNAARLMGELEIPEAVPLLLEALKSEPQRFVRPSLILALGKIGGSEVLKALQSYIVPDAIDASETKHAIAERDALTTALAALASPKRHTFTNLKRPYLIELRAPDRLSVILENELRALGFSDAHAVDSSSVRLTTDNITGLYEARSFQELLFVAADDAALIPKSIVFKAKPFLEELMVSSHEGEPPFGCRVEIRGNVEERATLAKETAQLLQGNVILNAPGSYEAELRVEPKVNGGARLFIKLHSVLDDRFSYRLAAIPASIHPATAAAVLRYAGAYLKENARVLDPFCGSGTLLIEREKYRSCEALTGVDIAHAAIDIARQNAAAAESHAKFIVNDCLRFTANRKYDEVIANLPFGNRVGTHQQNERLYKAFVTRLSEWLKPNGVAVLYTMEFTLLKNLIRETPALKLIAQERTEAGGLMPGIFVLQVKPR
ncbi:MAG TPA: HEAT repeat domain-containing protein [Clostridia bacterium]|nr:HEAT repeat domain-containing protein [Clostridia bacterium]